MRKSQTLAPCGGRRPFKVLTWNPPQGTEVTYQLRKFNMQVGINAARMGQYKMETKLVPCEGKVAFLSPVTSPKSKYFQPLSL